MSNSMVRRVGIIGLGKMGHPMARHLQKAGFDVTACDIDALVSAVLEFGARRAASPGQLAVTEAVAV